MHLKTVDPHSNIPRHSHREPAKMREGHRGCAAFKWPSVPPHAGLGIDKTGNSVSQNLMIVP